MQRSILPIAVISAVIGAGAAVGIVEGLDLGSARTTTTLVQQAPFGATSNANDGDAGLTAGDIYKRDAPGVVFVRSQIVQRTQSPFDFGLPQEQQGEATGSGFVVDQAGTILTNAHVVNGATKVTVQFQNKQSVEAKVLGKDESTDLALLKVDPTGLRRAPLTLGSSKGVQVGDPAIAIGNPFGLERTLTTGVISAVQRTIQAPNNFEIDDVLQTDAPINPGNSGGPLIDATGKVIGINSQIATGGSASQGSVGIGFAVPIDTAKQARWCSRSLRAARPTRRASAPATSRRRWTTTRSNSAATSSSRSPARRSAPRAIWRRPSRTASRATGSRSRCGARARSRPSTSRSASGRTR